MILFTIKFSDYGATIVAYLSPQYYFLNLALRSEGSISIFLKRPLHFHFLKRPLHFNF